MIEDVLKPFEWFRIDKYDEACKQLSYEQWIFMLWERCNFWNFDPLVPPVSKYKSLERWIKPMWEKKKVRYQKFIEQIMNGDAIDVYKLDSGDGGYEGYIKEHEGDALTKINSSYLNFIAANNGIDGMSPEEYMERINNDDPKYINLTTRRVVDYDIENEGEKSSLYIEVDLNARDDVIFEGLKKMLGHERQKRGISPVKYITEKDIDKFINLRVIHYLDLIIFSKAMSLCVNNVVLSRLLYPDEYKANPVERVRKTMPELAKYVMSERLLMASEYKKALE